MKRNAKQNNKELINKFLQNGGQIQVIAPAAPRKEEKTFRNNKLTMFNIGRQKSLLRGIYSNAI